MATLNFDRAQPGWRFWLLWMGASIAGVIVLYGLVFSVIIYVLSALVPMQQIQNTAPGQQWTGIVIGLFSFAAIGAAIGAAQWLVLRRYVRGAGWWVLATMIGYGVPLVAGPLLSFRKPPWLAGVSMFLTFGVILGILQWLTLRGRVYQAGWWVAISILGWLAAYALAGVAIVSGLYVEPFDLLAAFFVPVAVAGAGIIWLLRQSALIIQAAG